MSLIYTNSDGFFFGAWCIAMGDMNGKICHVRSVPYLPYTFDAELQSRWSFDPRPRSPEVPGRDGSELR